MLVALSIRDIVLIDTLHIEFDDGLTVLTGETGAGKSILLDALALALGGRGDAGLVRQSVHQGQVTAQFHLPQDHPACVNLATNDVVVDGDIILRRVQTSDGRTRAYINDSPVSAALLKTIGSMLVEIHGQHDDRALIEPASHRQLLDAFGSLEDQSTRVADAWQACQQAEKELAELHERVAGSERERDYLTACVDELRGLDAQGGEEPNLAASRQAMMQAEKVAGQLADAYQTIAGSGSPVPVLSGLLRRLERKAAETPELLEGPVGHLVRALDALEDTRVDLEQAIAATQYDAGELERAEERLFALRAAGRKHGVTVEKLPHVLAQMESDLAAIESGSASLPIREQQARAARTEFDALAADLSRLRVEAGLELERATAGELGDLKLDQAQFQAQVFADTERPGQHGYDSVEFWVQTNPGTRAGPLRKVASGGELSRLLLAIKVSLADRGSAPTLIFDEIDTGVGGAIAEAIGVRLARLADKVQVISVTHAPQVAARARAHLLISKSAGDGTEPRTRVAEIANDQRREEIARMLAGAQITDAARAAADQLLVGLE